MTEIRKGREGKGRITAGARGRGVLVITESGTAHVGTRITPYSGHEIFGTDSSGEEFKKKNSVITDIQRAVSRDEL